MTKLTYKQAYDKIIEAYFKDEIKPYEPKFCFCGNLNDKIPSWGYDDSRYKLFEFEKMEEALLDTIHTNLGYHTWHDFPTEVPIRKILAHPKYEDALFEGMSAALEVLKQIHKERGENVEDFQFTKRQIQNQTV